MKALLLIIIIIIVDCIFARTNANNDEDVEVLIINGKTAVQGQFPYIASIFKIGKGHWCGASIVAPTWLVSAAHCYRQAGAQYLARAGLLVKNRIDSNTQIIAITNIINHPYWNGIQNDVALLKLNYPLRFNQFVQPINLPRLNSIPTGIAVVAGWGLVNTQPRVEASVLQYLEMYLITNGECNNILTAIASRDQITDDKICTLPYKAHQSTCFADSGGPLVQNNVLVGIVHGGPGKNCTQEYSIPAPSYFAKVSLYTDFIMQNIQH